jgi:hypothetical protein
MKFPSKKESMKKHKFFYVICLFLVVCPSFGQTVQPSRFSFEQLSFGDSIVHVRRSLVGKQLSRGPRAIMPFSPKIKDAVHYVYDDTCFGKWVGISLSFQGASKQLTYISVAFTGVNPTSGKNYRNVEELVNELWNRFFQRYGKADAMEDVPMLGKQATWRKPNVIIRMLKSKQPKPLLLITFEPTKKD